MASKSALLRNIRPSGGLITENILLRLRDNPERVNIGKIKSFVVEDSKEQRDQFKEKRRTIFDWCIQKWDEISPKIKNTLKEVSFEKWSLDDLIQKWLIPFFEQFDYELETFEKNEENIDNDSPLNDFELSFQYKEYLNPFFQFVNIEEDLDFKISNNPQSKSHHNVCQQFINLNPEINWLFLSNGRILRILTKYYHSYSKGYLEFDLENIFANRDEMEFNTLYSIIHSSRFNSKVKDGTLLIDKFQKDSITEGVKIGDTLRDNVEHALALLGNELIQQNLDKIDLDIIDVNEFYAELLRIIYRIIFILYAEQRDMLPGAGSLYFEQFSLSSLRIRAEKPIKAERNYDLWNKMLITFNLVRDGNLLLGVNSYNGSLFKEDNLRITLKNGMKISNDIVLKVIRLLTTSANHKVRQRINFLEVSEEEIGAIYESLLDFKPYISSTSQFQLIEGTERKSTGSYYTPKALIDILIRTTLQPLVEDRLIKAGDDEHAREIAILDLKVCDPACGGGTFLLSALDYLGKKLAEIRTSSDSPLEDDLREARREVLQHCIYGVDMNPLAVELAKISLWLRACVKNKPLNFLDNHIKCGNSLIGLGQKIEINEINPYAFEATAGNKATGIPTENKNLQSAARDVIKREIKQRKMKGKTTLITSFFTERGTADICSEKFKEIIDLPETNPNKIKEKEQKYEELRLNENYRQALNEANIWTSTFFWPFKGDVLGEIPRYTTIEQLRDDIDDPELNNLMKKINEISNKNHFFHWFIEFPEVFSSENSGFDCILTNPPWNVYSLIEEEFFLQYNKEIAKSRSKQRAKLILQLKKSNSSLYDLYSNKKKNFEKGKVYFRKSGFYKLTAIGKLDLYPLFTERGLNIVSQNGVMGIICPIGLIYSYDDFFNFMLSKNYLFQCVGFINTNKLFSTVASQKQFITLSLMKNNTNIPRFRFNVEDISQLYNKDLFFKMNYEELKMININSKTPPFPKNQYEYEIIKKIYINSECILKNIKDPNSNIKIHRMFNISDDRRKGILFLKKELEEQGDDYKLYSKTLKSDGKNIYLPVYEGKLIYQYDYIYGTYKGVDYKDLTSRRVRCNSNEDKTMEIVEPRYWVQKKHFLNKIKKWDHRYKWFLSYRESTGPLNERTIIFTVIPCIPTVYTLYNFINLTSRDAIFFISQFNTYFMDFIFRKKMATNHLTQDDIAQLPFISRDNFNLNKNIIIPLVLELIYTSNLLGSFAKEIDNTLNKHEWDEERRFELKRRLDAIYAVLWNLNKQEISYILEDFQVVKYREIKKYGEFKSKNDILNYYDEYVKIIKQR